MTLRSELADHVLTLRLDRPQRLNAIDEPMARALLDALRRADESADIRQLKLKDWQPRSMLVTKASDIPRPAFPAIDVHNHLGGGKQTLTPERVARYLEEMDAAGVRTVVNLDGQYYAFSDTCTHRGCELHEGQIVASNQIQCPCHGARFDMTTGHVLAGPTQESLKTASVSVQDGKLVLN